MRDNYCLQHLSLLVRFLYICLHIIINIYIYIYIYILFLSSVLSFSFVSCIPQLECCLQLPPTAKHACTSSLGCMPSNHSLHVCTCCIHTYLSAVLLALPLAVLPQAVEAAVVALNCCCCCCWLPSVVALNCCC